MIKNRKTLTIIGIVLIIFCLTTSALAQSRGIDTSKLRLDMPNATSAVSEDKTTKFLREIMLQRVLREDSMFVARGISMENAFDQPSTTPMSSPEGSKIILKMLTKDGLATADKPIKFNIIPYLLYVDGKMQSAELGRKYGEFWLDFLRNDPDSKAMEQQNREKSRFVFNHITVQMLKDDIIRYVHPLTFLLNNETFEVNGKVQPAEVYQRYFDMFVKPMPNGKMSYGLTR